MSLGTRVPAAVELGTAADLRRAIGLLAPAALLFAIACMGASFVFADAPMGGIGVVLFAAGRELRHLLAIAQSGPGPGR